jgi:hypothetical protein
VAFPAAEDRDVEALARLQREDLFSAGFAPFVFHLFESP